MKKSVKVKNDGFTLVELAIVIIIIGLLVGGVLQGQSLIRQSKIHSATVAAESYKAALNSFRGKYNCLPGDCINATTFFSGTSNISNGDNDGYIRSTNESIQAWRQLGISNFIKGNYSGTSVASLIVPGTNSPVIFDNVTANFITIAGWNMNWSNTNGTGMQHLVFGTVNQATHVFNWQPFLETSEAYGLDTKIDDGLPGKGEVRVHTSHVTIINSSLCTNAYDANTTTYSITNSGINCNLVYLLNL
jgi:prepilin-type N-terminal cleavage/methylation domain-containing protein